MYLYMYIYIYIHVYIYIVISLYLTLPCLSRRIIHHTLALFPHEQPPSLQVQSFKRALLQQQSMTLPMQDMYVMALKLGTDMKNYSYLTLDHKLSVLRLLNS